MEQNPCIPMTQAHLSLRALLTTFGAALLTLPGAAFAQDVAVSRATTPAAEPPVLEVISLRNSCEEGTPFFHEYGTFVMMQYGYRSCRLPLF